ncbi:hypothetical protein NLJ89_g2691 [Agrocybe chaxingu]|uniref:Uncharacterized protein n=1 Tax=Agrocybe chaxingu TaxID=84603 RepID=A0A9W8K6B1_9AGAR|nr:hypothetical protein NLJ89_g2691 [Agrocybe chaxingu]
MPYTTAQASFPTLSTFGPGLYMQTSSAMTPINGGGTMEGAGVFGSFEQYGNTAQQVLPGEVERSDGGMAGGIHMEAGVGNVYNQSGVPLTAPVLQTSLAENHGQAGGGWQGELNWDFSCMEYAQLEGQFTLPGNLFSHDLFVGLSGGNAMTQIMGEGGENTQLDVTSQSPYTEKGQLVLPSKVPSPEPASPCGKEPTATGNDSTNRADGVPEKLKRGRPKVANPAQDENEPENRARRTRRPATSKEVVPLTAKDVPVSPPEWLTTAYSYLKEGIEDVGWLECIAEWFKFEQQVLLESTAHRLPVKKRPEALSRWLLSRKYPPPAVEDPGMFKGEWMVWWNSLQPEWRRGAENAARPLPFGAGKEEEDVSSLRKGGPSGLVTVVIGLKWWRTQPHWNEAVADVKACLGKVMDETKKRKAASQGGRGKGGGKRGRTM